MRKSLTIFGAVLLLASTHAYAADGAPPTQTAPSIIEKLSVSELNDLVNSANFLVHVGSNGLCSGTLVSLKYKLILTAHHCVDFAIRTVSKEVNEDGEVKKKDVEVHDDVMVEQTYYSGARSVGASTYQTELVDYDKDHDLALLQVRADKIPNTQAVEVFSDAKGTVLRGDEVWAFGNPLGLENSVSFGHIASTTRLFKFDTGAEVTFLQTDAGMLTFGNSGGALLKGKYLIGVPDMTVPGTPVSLSIPYDLVQKLLTKNCYEEVWNGTPKQTFDACDAERKAKEATKDESTKDMLRKFLDKQAKPTGAAGGYLFEPSGALYGYLGALNAIDYTARMTAAKGCVFSGFQACVDMGEIKTLPPPVPSEPVLSPLQRLIDAWLTPQVVVTKGQ